MNLSWSESDTADDLIKKLVGLRFYARRAIAAQGRVREDLKRYRAQLVKNPGLPALLELIGMAEESELKFKFAFIEAGSSLPHLCNLLDKKVDRSTIFEALNINQSHRDTESVREYGTTSIGLIAVLGLENSATNSDEVIIKPLKWCNTIAFMHALKTNSKLDKIVHEGANEFFGDIFGEWVERPLMERLAGANL